MYDESEVEFTPEEVWDELEHEMVCVMHAARELFPDTPWDAGKMRMLQKLITSGELPLYRKPPSRFTRRPGRYPRGRQVRVRSTWESRGAKFVRRTDMDRWKASHGSPR